jgi:hypothetical protein
VIVPEPTVLGDGPFYANEPPEGTKTERVETRSPTGDLVTASDAGLVVVDLDGACALAAPTRAPP